jgi:2'-5' RNA ligase
MRIFYGIASQLDSARNAEVETLWRVLDEICGLKGVQITPVPHFSWQIVEGYNQDALLVVLADIAKKTKPFTAHTTGLGIFSGEMPVIYIPVVKDAVLLRFHEMLWEQTREMATGISPYYTPENWIPHITLAHGDVDHQNIHCALEKLAFRTYNWEFVVDHLVLGNQLEDEVWQLQTLFPFEG